MKETWPAAAEVLARGGSASDAAKAARVDPRTIRRWKADEPPFADAIEQAIAELEANPARTHILGLPRDRLMSQVEIEIQRLQAELGE